MNPTWEDYLLYKQSYTCLCASEIDAIVRRALSLDIRGSRAFEQTKSTDDTSLA